MWKKGARIYGTPGVPNNFPKLSAKKKKKGYFDLYNFSHERQEKKREGQLTKKKKKKKREGLYPM